MVHKRYLDNLYKNISDGPVAVKTAVGDVHLTQSAYLTKLQRTKTRLDGTLTLGVTDPRDEAIEEANGALLRLTRESEAEKFLKQMMGTQ